MKRPVNYQQPLASVMQKEGHKKRKIQPVFLGALGSTLNMSHQQESGVVLSKSLGNDSPHQGTQQLSATAMRANPGLIGRVTSADVGAGQEADGGRERSSSQQSPSTSHRGAGEGSSNVVEDSMNGSTFLNSTCENVEKNQRDELRTLPELNLEAAMTLKPLPRAVCLQNIAKMGLPPPQLHKALSLPVPLGPMCQVDQIVVKNALNNKRGIKYAKIQAKFGRELRWSQTVGSPLLLIHANCNWVVSAHEDNSMVVFCTPTGKISLSLHIDSPIACLEVRHQICLALTTTAELWTWDLRKSVHILRTSIKTLLLGCAAAETLQIVRASLSTNGVPILVLSNGDVFIFSRSLRSWLSLNLNRDFLLSHLPSLQFIARSLPNGLISLVADILNSGKLDGRPPSTNLGEEAESANEESQLEMLLKAASELDAREEYRLLAAIYTQKLAKKRKLNKIVEFMDEVRANSSHTVGMETILTDLRLVLKQNGLSDVDAIRNDEQGRERELEASLSLLA